MYYPMPEPQPQLQPESRQDLVRHDRLAVAIGNASLLGVGYLLLGRRAWAVVTTLVTIAWGVLLGTAVPGVWFEVLFVVWWAALIAHGWYLAGKPARPASVRWPRAIALLIAVPVLAAIGYVRYDATRVENTIAEARDSGDCGKAQSAVDTVWFGHYVVDGPMAVRSELTAQACARLRKTESTLTNAASTRNISGLGLSYHELSAVLTDLPGHDRMVGTVLDGFLGGLSGHPPCDVADLTDWLRHRPPSNNLLDRSADVVPKLAPTALVGCADELAGKSDWDGAKARYQQVLTLYPGHELTAKAQEGATKATQALELRTLFTLGEGYCRTPAIYSAAAPYTKGATNRAVVYHPDKTGTMEVKKLPAEWQTDNAQAVMVVCVGQRDFGAPIRSCRYRAQADGKVRNVTFTKMAFPVKAYELRTGNLVIDTRVEIGGAVCPPLVLLGDTDPARMLATPSDADIRAAFAPVFTS